jgi:hypothetical protein
MPNLAVAPAQGLGRSGVCEARLRSSVRAMHRFGVRVVLLAVTLVAAAPAASASATTLLHLDGIGPLRLGMSRTAAVATGWLSNRAAGCELASPRPITYRFAGRRSPDGLRGVAEFDSAKLTDLSFTRGVRTATGVRVGRTTSARMVARYRAAGFLASATFVDTFSGTFVRVRRRNGREVLGAFTQGRVISTLAIPAVPVCE